MDAAAVCRAALAALPRRRDTGCPHSMPPTRCSRGSCSKWLGCVSRSRGRRSESCSRPRPAASRFGSAAARGIRPRGSDHPASRKSAPLLAPSHAQLCMEAGSQPRCCAPRRRLPRYPARGTHDTCDYTPPWPRAPLPCCGRSRGRARSSRMSHTLAIFLLLRWPVRAGADSN